MVRIMNEEIRMLAWVIPVCSFAGLAALLRSQQPLTGRAIVSAVINSAIFGLAVGWWLLWRVGSEHFGLIVSVSALSGLGGTAAIDFCIELLKTMLRNKVGEE